MNHLSYSSDDGFHFLCHGLLKGVVPGGGEEVKMNSTCKLCLCPSRIVKDIRNVVINGNPSIRAAINDAHEKFELYMGHCMRSKVQQDRIDAVVKSLKTEGRGKLCVLYIDFKIKQLPKKLREPSQDKFGKRGMPWHVTVVFHVPSEHDKSLEDDVNKELEDVRPARKGNRKCRKKR